MARIIESTGNAVRVNRAVLQVRAKVDGRWQKQIMPSSTRIAVTELIDIVDFRALLAIRIRKDCQESQNSVGGPS